MPLLRFETSGIFAPDPCQRHSAVAASPRERDARNVRAFIHVVINEFLEIIGVKAKSLQELCCDRYRTDRNFVSFRSTRTMDVDVRMATNHASITSAKLMKSWTFCVSRYRPELDREGPIHCHQRREPSSTTPNLLSKLRECHRMIEYQSLEHMESSPSGRSRAAL